MDALHERSTCCCATPARIRIAFITDIVTPYLVTVLASLAERVHLTVLFCSWTGTRGMEWSVDLPFRHEVIEGPKIRRRTDASDYYFSPRIASALHRTRPQAIISGGFSIPTLYAALYGRVRGIPLVIQSDGTSDSEKHLRIEQRLSRRFLRRLAWGAAANSEPAARRFVEIGFPSERVILTPHAIRIDPYWEVARSRPDASRGPLRLLSIGRLIPRKGCEWLLRAAAEARGHGVDVELTIAGAGPDERLLKGLAAQLGVPVTWRGFIDQPELPKLYADADAFAFPTLDDPFGIVLIEAAASGLPIVASPFAGATEELVREGVNGFVIDPTDTVAMAAAIARLASEPELRDGMGKASYALTQGRTAGVSATRYLEAVMMAVRSQGG